MKNQQHSMEQSWTFNVKSWFSVQNCTCVEVTAAAREVLYSNSKKPFIVDCEKDCHKVKQARQNVSENVKEEREGKREGKRPQTDIMWGKRVR